MRRCLPLKGMTSETYPHGMTAITPTTGNGLTEPGIIYDALSTTTTLPAADA
jgi:hypothetical protein